MLNFIGSGNASNTDLGNNSAFFTDNDSITFIDFGYTNYQTFLKNKDFFLKYSDINIIITHMHSDHISGITDLILYLYFTKSIRVNIFISNDLENDFSMYLKILGVHKYCYNLTFSNNFSIGNNKIEFIKTNHVNNLTGSYSLVINDNTFYSSDISIICDNIKNIFTNKRILTAYFDCSYSENPVHTSLIDFIDNKDLFEKVKNKYFMHLDNHYNDELFKLKVERMGFKLVCNYFDNVL